jgi:hypothetical protein
MKSNQRGFAGIVLMIWAIFAIGWVLNIVQIFSTMPAKFGDATPMFVAKIVCVFIAPVGSVLGYVGLF